MSNASSRSLSQNIGLILGPVLALLILIFFNPEPENPSIGRMAAVVVVMAIWWITEALPLAATSLLPMVLFPLLSIARGTDIAKSYMNSLIFLYMGGFLIALAMERWNLHRRIALTIIYLIGKKPDRIILGFMLAAGFLSMWISNTATTVMMLPIGLAIITKMEEAFGAEKTHRLSLNLLIGIAYGCSIGGVATLVGTPTNLAFVKIYNEMFPEMPPINFGQWFLTALPISIVVLFLTWVLLTKVVSRMDKSLVPDREVLGKELRSLGPLGYEEKVVLVIWITTALLWVFRSDLMIGDFRLPGWKSLWSGFKMVDDSTVAMLMAMICFIFPAGKSSDGKALLEVDAFKRLPWGAILLFGGGFALAAGFGTSGLTQYLADQFSKMGSMPMALTVVLGCIGVTLLTELVSNVATVQMLVPVLAAWAISQNFNPLLIMIPATIVASMAFMMPVATPPNAIIFGSQRLRIVEMVKVGFFIKLAAVFLTILMAMWLVPLFFNVQ